MDKEIQKETQPSSDSIFGDINNDMIESGKKLSFLKKQNSKNKILNH